MAATHLLGALRAGNVNLPRKLHVFVCGHLLYRRRDISAFGTVGVLREVMRCFKRDLELVDMEKLTRADLEERSGFLFLAVGAIVQFCGTQMRQCAVGSPDALLVLRIVIGLFEMRRFSATHVPLPPLLGFVDALLAQLTTNQEGALSDVYVNAAAALLLRGLEDVADSALLGRACAVLLPWLHTPKAAFFFAATLDRRPPFLAQMLVEPTVQRIVSTLLTVFVKQGAEEVDDLDDPFDSDEASERDALRWAVASADSALCSTPTWPCHCRATRRFTVAL